MIISHSRIYVTKEKIVQAIENIKKGRLSNSKGEIEVDFITGKNAYQVVKGHHRLLENYINGEISISGKRTYESNPDNSKNSELFVDLMVEFKDDLNNIALKHNLSPIT